MSGSHPPPLSKIIDEVHAMEGELREHYKEYKELAKPPECDETWYCLQYLELLIEEILGDIPPVTGHTWNTNR